MTRRWQNRSEIILALVFSAVPLLFVAGLAILQLASNVPEARRARANTVLSFQTLRAVSAVDEALQDAERGQRGFLITGRDTYLDPYERAKKRLPQLMLDLQAATAEHSDQQQRLLKLQADVTTKMNELASTVTAMRERGFDAAKVIVDNDAGRLAMEAVTADLEAISEAAQERLAARLIAAADAEGRMNSTFIFGTAISALGLVVGGFLLVGAVRRATASEEVLQATLDSVREGVAAIDHRGRLRAWNAPFAAILGDSDESLRTGAPFELDGIGDGALGGQLRELAAGAHATGRPALREVAGAKGRRVEIFHNPSGDGGFVVTMLDVTERQKTEEALRQAQTLESVGRMTGGVAHDFNNLLTVIIGGLGMLRRAVGRDSQAQQRIDMMTTAAERATRLIRQLLAFARRQPLQPEVVNLGPVIQEALPLIRRAVGESVTRRMRHRGRAVEHDCRRGGVSGRRAQSRDQRPRRDAGGRQAHHRVR